MTRKWKGLFQGATAAACFGSAVLLTGHLDWARLMDQSWSVPLVIGLTLTMLTSFIGCWLMNPVWEERHD